MNRSAWRQFGDEYLRKIVYTLRYARTVWHEVRMGAGKRAGYVKKEELLKRLAEAHATMSPGLALPSKDASMSVIVGHCMYYGLLNAREFEETVPRESSVLPCYLGSVVRSEAVRGVIEAYVRAASRLYRRGSIILNRVAMDMCGSRLPSAGDITVPVWRPHFKLQDGNPAADELIAFLDIEGNPYNGVLKHAFLPERWPTEETPRSEVISAAMQLHEAHLPPCPDWRAVIPPTGWDNAVSRMASKYVGNIQVHVRARLLQSAQAYMRVVPLETPDAAEALATTLGRRLRPLAVHQDDWDLLMEVRSALGVPEENLTAWAPDSPAVTPQLLKLHLFLCRYGVTERTYLPVASRGRKFCYLDKKITASLLAAARRGHLPVPRPVRRQAAAGQDDETAGVSLGDMLDLCPSSFNARRKASMRRNRKQLRKAKGKRETPAQRRKRLDRGIRRRTALGRGRMPAGARIDSLETDGVGLRICLKVPVDMCPFKAPFPEAGLQQPAKKRRHGARQSGKDGKPCAVSETTSGGAGTENADPPCCGREDCCHALMCRVTVEKLATNPVFVGVDCGRAKPYVAAISKEGFKKPQSLGFTRRRYYFDMRHSVRTRWEQQRVRQVHGLQDAIGELARSGGLRNCDAELWDAYFEAEAPRRELLDTEYIDNTARATWRMAMFCFKRSSLDRAADRMVRQATEGVPTQRPLVVGVGAGGFASTGRGEMAAPTAEMDRALGRALRRERLHRGREVHRLSIDEFRTTLCCCACGELTSKVFLRDRRSGEPRTNWKGHKMASHRLRSCTSCSTTGKQRDRDVQGARNMLWLTQLEYFGLERPAYLSRVS